MTHGGRTPTGLDAVEWAEQVVRARRGRDPAHVDGPRRHEGRATTSTLLRAVGDAVDVPVIASGGVGTLEHLYEGAAEGGAGAVLAASIFHFGQHTVREAKAYLARAGPRRPAVTGVPAVPGRVRRP